ncbi:MAG: ROK family glucokinase [Ornithinimicrobium sp.]
MSVNIGVDVGGTKIAACAVDEDGLVVARAKKATPAQDVDAIVSVIVDVVQELRSTLTASPATDSQPADSPRGLDAVGVGVACAGFVDAAGEKVVFAPNLAWRDEPLAARVGERIDLPVVLENDANAAAWGEYRFGAARHAEHMIMVTLGTGVGGGIIDRDQLLRGAEGMAAEIGHLRVVPDGHRCGCGNRGCWEQYASGSALVREARELVAADSTHAADLIERCGGEAQALTGSMVTQSALEGEQAAIELMEDLGRWVGEGIASLVAVLDTGVIVMGGGVSAAGDLVLEPARAAFARQLTARGHRPVPPIIIAQLGNDAGMIGAADLAAQRLVFS